MRLALLPLALLPLAAQPELIEKKTLARIEAIDQKLSGALGVAAIDLTTGRVFSHHGESVFAQASLIKVPILVTAFQAIDQGRLNPDTTYTLTEKDKVGGDGNLQFKLEKGPATLSFRELLTLMIRDSDNTAANKVIALVRMENVTALAARLGLPNTRLRRVMMDSAAAARGDENTSTPLEMARLFELIHRGKTASPASTREMIALLKLVRDDFRAALPANVESASKPGDIPGVRTEAGIVFLDHRPYVLSVMSSFLAPKEDPIRDVVEAVHAHFALLAASNPYGHRVR